MSSDASKRGLGAVLEQEHEDKWFPVAFASRTLTTSEENYCPLEKEALSVEGTEKNSVILIEASEIQLYNEL